MSSNNQQQVIIKETKNKRRKQSSLTSAITYLLQKRRRGYFDRRLKLSVILALVAVPFARRCFKFCHFLFFFVTVLNN